MITLAITFAIAFALGYAFPHIVTQYKLWRWYKKAGYTTTEYLKNKDRLDPEGELMKSLCRIVVNNGVSLLATSSGEILPMQMLAEIRQGVSECQWGFAHATIGIIVRLDDTKNAPGCV